MRKYLDSNVVRLVVIGVIFALTVAACSDGGEGTEPADAADGEAPSVPQEVVIGQTQDLPNFAPMQMAAAYYTTTLQLYNMLIRLDEDLQPQPELAGDWEVAEDGTSITLELVEAEFHNGDPVTSEDVKFSIEYAQDEDNAANVRPLAVMVTEVETPDDRTAVVHFDSPNPSMFDMFNLMPVVNHRNPDTIDSDANGTGPFVLEEAQPGQEFVFVRNENYWREPPAVEKVTIRILPDSQALSAQLQAGAVDLIQQITYDQYRSLADHDDLVTGVTAEGQTWLHFLINVQNPPMDDRVVREALSLAVDRERITREVVSEDTQPGCLPYPEQSLAYFQDLAESCTYDLEAAEALLDEAGYDDLEIRLTASSDVIGESPRMAEILQADLEQIGVNAIVEDVDTATFLAGYHEGTFQVMANRYGRAAGDPATMFGTARVWWPDGNPSGFESDEYVELAAQGASTLDEDARRDAYYGLGELILEENFIIAVAPTGFPWAATSELEGLDFSTYGQVILENATHTGDAS